MPYKQADEPLVGRIYRDRFDRSLLVWKVARDKIVVEYSDGRVTAVGTTEWNGLKPHSARF
jgi:hypothetical protein